MVRRERIPAALVVLCSAAFVLLAPLGCKKKKPAGPPAIEKIKQSEPNRRVRALRERMRRLTKAGKYDEAAKLYEPLAKGISDLLGAMERIHFRKTAVPDFAVVRYVEALRDLGRNLRGFERLYSPKNPPQLKKEMLEGLLDQLDRKVR